MSFIMIEHMARRVSPKRAEMAVNARYTTIGHSDRTNRSPFTLKNSLPLTVPRVSWGELAKVLSDAAPRRASRRYLSEKMMAAVSRPEYWAMNVPQAIPEKPMPEKEEPGMPRANRMLATIFIPLTIMSVSIDENVSCIPMNQPLRVIRLKVAGAAQILMWKYLRASVLTSSELCTNKNISFWKGHWMRIRKRAEIIAAPSPFFRSARQASQSSRP